jgi:hypothetical protein
MACNIPAEQATRPNTHMGSLYEYETESSVVTAPAAHGRRS